MKNRSYKISTNDDWVEESWTVDCVCGVNFDDGEEMVNCDDCGVWVHTRCSNYVKSEKSFACDKCKNRKTRNNSEETEVAQMLVDLPTKTLRMDNPTSYVPPPPKLPSAPTLIRPCRQWTEIPIKERVHIQGIPGVGDDPSIFSGVSSVFSPQLWKCAGYVPKKFNFHYKEFPDWEDGDEEKDLQKKNGVVSLDDGILISSNSEIPSDPDPTVAAEEGMKTKNGEVEHDNKQETPEQAPPKPDSTVSVVLKPCLGVTKDPIFIQSSPVQCGKRKAAESGMLKDRSGKKKVKTMENQGEFKKNMQFLGPDSTNSSDVRKLQEERSHASVKDDPIGNQISKSSDTIRGHQLSGNNPVDHHSNDHNSNNSGSSKNRVKEQSLDSSIDHFTRKEITKEGKCGSSSPEKSEDLSCGISSEGQVAINSDANAAKSESRLPSDVRINLNKSEIVSKDVPIIHTKVQDNCELNLQPLPIVYKSKTGEIQTQSKKIYSDSPINRSEHISGPKNTSKKFESKTSDGSSFPTCGSSVITSSGPKNTSKKFESKTSDVSSFPACGSSVITSSGPKNTSKKFESKTSDEPLTCNNGSIRAVSPVFGNCTSVDVEDSAGKPKKHSEGNIGNYKDIDNSTVVEESPNRQKILLTKLIKSTQTKTPPFHSSNSKKTFSEPVTVSAANTLPPVPALSASPPQLADVNNSQPEIGSDVEKKGSSKNVNNASVLSQKVEKTNQNVPLTSSKVNTSLAHVATTSSNSSATLTDEELALLLHQELNSSPRVPRVPRMRHAGSLPQLTSPTLSTIMKRTSSVGGKEHGSGPRRRDKEFPKDNPDADDENKTEWAPYLSDQGGGGQDSGWTPRLARDIGNGSSSAKSTAAATTSNSSPVETTVNRPPRNPSDDNIFTTAAPRTLPGLIAEIMSKGERMMYEDLCNAVLPHWPNLRKHNGERYAYASHSQGVLDCLRNRIEWARLVDRGPKTCVGRRRRKVVSDHHPGIESEDNEDNNRVKNHKGNKSHEESPKSKREESRKWRSQKGGRATAATTTAATTTTTTTSRSSSRRRRIEEFSDDDEAESYLSCSEDTSVSDHDDDHDDDDDDDDDDEMRRDEVTRDGTDVSKRNSDGI